MAEPSARLTRCPRCEAPITGEFKFCPTCACRLRSPVDPAPPGAPTGTRWTGVLVAVLLASLIVAIGLVGALIFFPHPPAAPPATNGNDGLGHVRLTVRDHLVDVFARLDSGYVLRSSPSDPDTYEEVQVGPALMMKIEVTRGMYEEFLRALESDPDRVLAIEGVRYVADLWRPKPEDAGALGYATTYINAWWDRVEENLIRTTGERPTRPPDLQAPLPEEYGTILFAPPSWIQVTGWGELLWALPRTSPDTDLPENLPVADVSWFDATAFAAWVSTKLGIECRLPYDMEWLQAANNGNPNRNLIWPWGYVPYRSACNSLNYWGEYEPPRPLPVMWTYQDAPDTTPERIHGLAGNVREWTVLSELYPVTTSDGSSVRFRESERTRLESAAPVFGGSFLTGIYDCALDKPPRYVDRYKRAEDLGFRLWMPYSAYR